MKKNWLFWPLCLGLGIVFVGLIGFDKPLIGTLAGNFKTGNLISDVLFLIFLVFIVIALSGSVSCFVSLALLFNRDFIHERPFNFEMKKWLQLTIVLTEVGLIFMELPDYSMLLYSTLIWALVAVCIFLFAWVAIRKRRILWRHWNVWVKRIKEENGK